MNQKGSRFCEWLAHKGPFSEKPPGGGPARIPDREEKRRARPSCPVAQKKGRKDTDGNTQILVRPVAMKRGGGDQLRPPHRRRKKEEIGGEIRHFCFFGKE